MTFGGAKPIRSQMRTDTKWMLPGSPSTAGIANREISRTNTRSEADSSAGDTSGSVTFSIVLTWPAPDMMDASFERGIHVAQGRRYQQERVRRVIDRKHERDAGQRVDVDGERQMQLAREQIDQAGVRRCQDVPGEGADQRRNEHRQQRDHRDATATGQVGPDRQPCRYRPDRDGADGAEHRRAERGFNQVGEAG